jgi:hypothetical protein
MLRRAILLVLGLSPLAMGGAILGAARRPIRMGAVAAADSIVVTVTNSMPHAWSLFRETSGARIPMGSVDPAGTTSLILRDVQGDSVTLDAISDEMGMVQQRFPTHSAKPRAWQL